MNRDKLLAEIGFDMPPAVERRDTTTYLWVRGILGCCLLLVYCVPAVAHFMGASVV